MSLHPNEVQRRGRYAAAVVAGSLFVLVGTFFRAQVLDYGRYALQSESNRLREVPLPAPRGIIFDRNGLVIAENIPGYTVSLLTRGPDSLRLSLGVLTSILPLSADKVEAIVRAYRKEQTRPAVVLSDATFEQVSVLEEHRTELPNLIIQASPKRYYPDGPVVSAIVGYTAQIGEAELLSSAYKGYKAGQEIGKDGLERQYETQLRGREGSRFVEVDARGRVVRPSGARPDLKAVAAPPLYTNIDLDLQRFVAGYFGDSLQGGAVALEPQTGAVLALHSAPAFDPNRFIGGIPADYWNSLNNDPRKPMYNKAMKGRYPPGSTFKLATAVVGLQSGLVTLNDRMDQPCTGGYLFGNRYFRCWNKKGHGVLTLAEAITQSCDVYFYQLGLRLTLANLVAGGVKMSFGERSGIDLPAENKPIWPYAMDYFTRKYGPSGFTNAVTLNLAIGQGENSQTILNMARFYTALATDGSAATPNIARPATQRTKIFSLTPEQLSGLRDAMADVISSRGTAASAQIQGVTIAGKTGSAQNGPKRTDAWFVGFAPKDDPKIVVAVMIEHGEHGYLAARVASKIIEHFLKAPVREMTRVEGGAQ
jgi:penicillin-binding protein 2